MSEAIIVALITGGLSLAGVIATNLATARKNEAAIRTSQAITDTKLEELTREVREHNHFARRMPVVEEQIKVINHRISDLENLAQQGGHIMKNRIDKLLSIKSLVTLAMTLVFSILALRGSITGQEYLSVFTTVIAFYFGTQTAKKEQA